MTRFFLVSLCVLVGGVSEARRGNDGSGVPLYFPDVAIPQDVTHETPSDVLNEMSEEVSSGGRAVVPPGEVRPDPRCLLSPDVKLSDYEAVRRENLKCDIEQEIIRRTNLRRAEENVRRAKMNPPLAPLPMLTANREMSYIVRALAKLPYTEHGHYHAGNPQRQYARVFPNKPLAFTYENAWPLTSQHGSDPKTIAWSMADHPATGWNRDAHRYPAGSMSHESNVINPGSTDVGVGVDLQFDAKGNIVSVKGYTHFGRRL